MEVNYKHELGVITVNNTQCLQVLRFFQVIYYGDLELYQKSMLEHMHMHRVDLYLVT